MSRIEQLALKIKHHKLLYYQGRPEISDQEFDALEEELRDLDPQNAVLQMVGEGVVRGDKIPHEKKMLSLNKVYNLKELKNWAKEYELFSTYKIDGVSCSLIYEKGRLVLAKTRGDGKFGEDILKKVLWIEDIPQIIPEDKKVEVRGEIYCREQEFISLSEEMEQRGLDRPSSQRNIVAGLLGRKDHIPLSRFLKFSAFELIGIDLKTEKEKFNILKEWNFNLPPHFFHEKNEDLTSVIDKCQHFMSDGDYMIDGLVFTLNKNALHEELGETSHHPRYKMAFKFKGISKEAIISEITWQVSRNGVLTPVAEISPIELSGAKISRVTLHNYGMVKAYHLKKGDKIEIIRSGEVIPKFLSLLKSSKNPFTYPRHCPSCDQIVHEEDIRLICKNSECPSQSKESILHFIKKIGIDDLSGKRLDQLIAAGLVSTIPDLYRLTREDLIELEKVKEKLAKKIIDNISKSKNVSLPIFLSALGVKGSALNKSEKIVEAGFDNINKIINMTENELINVESFAEKSAHEFIQSLEEKKTIISELLELGIKIKKEKNEAQKGRLKDLQFVITGTLTRKRDDIAKEIKAHGGKVASSVSSKTNYLITNDKESGSSKFKKAKELKIPIINEKKLDDLILSKQIK